MSPWPLFGAIVGVVCLAVAAHRRWLTPSGVAAALVTGAALIAGTHAAGPLLLALFLVSSSLLGRMRFGPEPDVHPHRSGPPGRTGDGPRNARQVLANSVVPAVAALLGAASVSPGAGAAMAGAIAAMTADTWATEIGTGLRAPARLLVGWQPVRPGESGGVSLPGTLAGLAGATVIALVAALLPIAAWGPARAATFLPVAAGGIVGLFTDSLLGATAERRFVRVDNETVNLLASLAGGVAAAVFTAVSI
ncbi:MAG: DUF92 domain-containing protein [marine benthic group bacterium]|jgi:uncharacterized protein (TIGR00297 family)|nr:DUF92 domain-containing protein [Gemmatimonadota bacterium]